MHELNRPLHAFVPIHQHYRTRRIALQGASCVGAMLLLWFGTASAAEQEVSPIPVTGSSQCPTSDAVWQELTRLFQPQDLAARLGAADRTSAPIRVEDLGAAFRVSVLGTTRQYREEARDCRRRARTSALFSALVLDPTAMLDASPPAPPPAPPAPPPPIPPAALPTGAPQVSEAVRPLVRIEGGAAAQTGLGQTTGASVGAAFRLGVGRGLVVPVLGVGVFLPSETDIAGVRVRQWRVPADLSMRLTMPWRALDWYGEAGLAFAVLREQALDVMTARAATGIELGFRAALGARLARPRGFAPFVLLQLDYLPDPPTIAILPAGEVGKTPHAWLVACVGLSWGIR
jgi:hypothetical protein